MNKYILTLCISIVISPLVIAGTMTFSKATLNEADFKADFKTETGLPPISRECMQSTCTVSGHYDYKGGTLTVVIYETLDASNVWITSTTFTSALQTKIQTAVDNN